MFVVHSLLMYTHLRDHYQALENGTAKWIITNTLIEKDHLGDWSPEKDCC